MALAMAKAAQARPTLHDPTFVILVLLAREKRPASGALDGLAVVSRQKGVVAASAL
jgi:hypothetical protein